MFASGIFRIYLNEFKNLDQIESMRIEGADFILYYTCRHCRTVVVLLLYYGMAHLKSARPDGTQLR